DPTVVVATHGDHPAAVITDSSKRNANGADSSTLSAGTKWRPARRGRHGPSSTRASAPSRTTEGNASIVRRQAGRIAAGPASLGKAEATAKRSVFRRDSESRAHRLHVRAPTATVLGVEGRSLHDVRQMYLGRLHTSRNQSIHRGVPDSPRVDSTGALWRLPGPPCEPTGAQGSALSALRDPSRRLKRRGTAVAPIAGVDPSPDTPHYGPQQVIIYRFSA